jgi:chromatin segregation and condensation protein Rec8/ScpA/Scc1 (kleisin family)
MEEPKYINEEKIIRTIIVGSDWQEVLTTIVIEDGMDPMSIDIIKLTDSFMGYLKKVQKFDFRIPARFVLIAATLLFMKCESLLSEEEEKGRMEGGQMPNIDMNNIPVLTPPLIRKPTRKVTLSELINALNRAMEFKERKEEKKFRIRDAVERLIEPEEDIEIKISRIFDKIVTNREINFSDLVPVWKKIEIVETFIPLLHLETRGMVVCEQEEMFKEIKIRIRVPHE